MRVVLQQTRRHWVLSLAQQPQPQPQPDPVAQLHEHGFVVLRGELAVPPAQLAAAAAALAPLLRRLQRCYDETEDAFQLDEAELESLGVVRLPRIGKGKHNVHFEPHANLSSCRQHSALVAVAEATGLPALLSAYQAQLQAQSREEEDDDGGSSSSSSSSSSGLKRPSQLRETGLTLTAPLASASSNHNNNNSRSSSSNSANNSNSSDSNNSSCNDNSSCNYSCSEGSEGNGGMEFHSDGPRGENTVLLAVGADVPLGAGALLLVPGSHRLYVDGVGHAEPGGNGGGNEGGGEGGGGGGYGSGSGYGYGYGSARAAGSGTKTEADPEKGGATGATGATGAEAADSDQAQARALAQARREQSLQHGYRAGEPVVIDGKSGTGAQRGGGGGGGGRRRKRRRRTLALLNLPSPPLPSPFLSSLFVSPSRANLLLTHPTISFPSPLCCRLCPCRLPACLPAPCLPAYPTARTLHAVTPNHSPAWRAVAWFIFDAF